MKRTSFLFFKREEKGECFAISVFCTAITIGSVTSGDDDDDDDDDDNGERRHDICYVNGFLMFAPSAKSPRGDRDRELHYGPE